VSASPTGRLALRNARLPEREGLADLVLRGDRVETVAAPGVVPACEREADLQGRVVLPGLVNAHDHLDLSTFPDLAAGRYANAEQWQAAVEARQGAAEVQAAVAVPPADRLFLGGLRNLLAGVTAVAHHGPFHRSLGRRDFPVHVLERYHFAHSPGLTRVLRRTYRTTDRRIPWLVHVAEGTDQRARDEIDALVRENVLRQNTVMIHAVAVPADKLPLVAEARACVVWCPESNRRLYGATADVAALRAAGIRVGLGSDSPLCGVRDALSNLAAARAERVLDDASLLALATAGSAEVARLPAGGVTPGARADLLAADTLEGLLAGDRRAVALVVVGGRARYGRQVLMAALEPASLPLTVEGEGQRIEPQWGRRAAAVLRAHPAARRTAWAAGVDFAPGSR
jgi:cytosine/adenosine deaminase-related metal-dependent hydrolase